MANNRINFLTALLLFVFIVACSPSRPSSVPDEAIWVGGNGGQVWVKVGDVDQANFKFFASVYSKEGKKLASGWFLFYAKEPYEPKGVNKEYIEKYVDAYDGTALWLNDIAGGRSLSYVIQK